MVDDRDEFDTATHCECGIPLASHPPLPKVRPLTSWHAERGLARPDISQLSSEQHRAARRRGRAA